MSAIILFKNFIISIVQGAGDQIVGNKFLPISHADPNKNSL